jgi:hypothetical protein
MPRNEHKAGSGCCRRTSLARTEMPEMQTQGGFFSSWCDWNRETIARRRRKKHILHIMNQPDSTHHQSKHLFPLRKRTSCLGCFIRIGALFAVLGAGYLIFIAIFMPWGYYLGGKFHIFPYWQGFGHLHSTISGGDYLFFVSFQPGTPGQFNSYIKGNGYVCTPQRKIIRLTLIGQMRKHLGVSTEGESIYMKAYNYQGFSRFFATPQRHPRIELKGKWQNPNIVMNDTGSISREFEPDGSVYTGNEPNRPYAREILPITLRPGSYADFKTACAAAQR